MFFEWEKKTERVLTSGLTKFHLATYNLLDPAPRPSNGPVPPGLLQLPASWPPGICYQTATTNPECCGTPDFQRSQIYAHHPAAHWPPLAACYSSHQIQDIGARIPGNQGISPRLHPTTHQTLHTDQTSTLRYLWTSGAPPPPPVTPALLVHDCSLFWPHDGGMTFLWTSEQPRRCPRSNADWKPTSSDCISPSLPHK